MLIYSTLDPVGKLLVSNITEPPYYCAIISKYSDTAGYFTVQLVYASNIIWSGYYFLVQRYLNYAPLPNIVTLSHTRTRFLPVIYFYSVY